MSKTSRFINLFLILAIALSGMFGALAAQRTAAAAWKEKVDPWVLETATEQAQTEFLVFLVEQADLSATQTMTTKLEKGTYVFETLSALAERTQKPVLAQLDALGVEHQSFWIANMIWVRGDMSVVQAMAQRPDVAHLYANPTVPLDALPEEDQQALLNPQAIEWNILMVNADDVWNDGVTGQGAVIGGHDTGYDWDHPALINQYRGWNGSSADHNYHWHDAIHVGGSDCGANSPVPCDDNGHGTHTMGTMVGDDGGSNQIGMAPGARWIGCRNMNEGDGTPTTYSECYQWFIAPTDLNNLNPDPSMAPDVINNSWGCPASEGCTDPLVLQTVTNNVRAAGILTAHSAGNSGSSCSTVNTPSAIYDASTTVGSTTSSNTMSGFSSRGPVTVDGSNRLKPDISAPGSSVRSSYVGGGYATLSGTSMAAPHVAGLVGLLVSANPALAGDVDMLEYIMEQTAVQVTVNPAQTCGGTTTGVHTPNNTFGWGRIDAFAAYQLAMSMANPTLEVTKSASATYIAPGEILTYTLEVSHTSGVSVTTNVVLTDVIPVNTTFVTATLPHNLNGSIVSWAGPDLNPGDSFTVQLVVQVDGEASGVITNDNYAVTSDESGTAFGEPVTTPVIAYGLELSKSASSFQVLQGGWITYTLTVTNQHPLSQATGLVLTDVIPLNTTFITATLPHALNGSVVQWDAASIPAAGSWSVELVVQVNEDATGTVDNVDYAVQSDQVSTVSGSPVSTLILTPGVSLSSDGASVAAPGEVVTYTHTVTNTGNHTDGYFITYTSSEGWTASVASSIVLASGDSATITIAVTVPLTATDGTVDTLTLTVTSQTDPSVSASVTDTTTVEGEVVVETYDIYLPLVTRSE